MGIYLSIYPSIYPSIHLLCVCLPIIYLSFVYLSSICLFHVYIAIYSMSVCLSVCLSIVTFSWPPPVSQECRWIACGRRHRLTLLCWSRLYNSKDSPPQDELCNRPSPGGAFALTARECHCLSVILPSATSDSGVTSTRPYRLVVPSTQGDPAKSPSPLLTQLSEGDGPIIATQLSMLVRQ